MGIENVSGDFLGNFFMNINNEFLTHGVITISAICLIILIANVLRRKIPLFRRTFMPTAVIAGLLGLVIKEAVLAVTGIMIFNISTLNWMVYHALPIAFIALSLREKDDYSGDPGAAAIHKNRVAPSKSGCFIIGYYMVQALVGIAVTAFLAVTFIPELNKAVGIMLALGYGQGPQQAFATGNIWDAAEAGRGYMSYWRTLDPNPARNYGLTIAAIGFLWASIPGIILVNIVARKKGISRTKDEFQKSGDVKSYSIEGPDEIPLSESIDKFSLQVCMVGGVYLFTIGFVIGLEMIFNASGVKFLVELIPTFWGFLFMLGALFALCTKLILRRLVKTGVMNRKYPNSYMMNRISGAAFDLSITAALILVSVFTLGSLWIPIIVMTTIGGLVTLFYVRFVTKHVYKNYSEEAFLGFYGMSVGTIANGMILLREIDPTFKSPAGEDLVLGSSAAIILALPLLFLIPRAPAEGNLWWVTLVIAGYFLALMLYLFKEKIFGRKKTA